MIKCKECGERMQLLSVVIVGYDEYYEEQEKATYVCPECGEIHQEYY